jgi:acylphosphatase
MKRVRIKVHGIVQGVFYRANTKDKARGLGLFGFVKNLPDGSVEVVAEGEGQALEDLISWCRMGPRGARVEKLDVSWEDPNGEFRGFSIAY